MKKLIILFGIALVLGLGILMLICRENEETAVDPDQKKAYITSIRNGVVYYSDGTSDILDSEMVIGQRSIDEVLSQKSDAHNPATDKLSPPNDKNPLGE